MAKHIHIHISTRDAGFNEGDHPRDHGKFTSGGGSKTASPTRASAAKAAKPKLGMPAGATHKVVSEKSDKWGARPVHEITLADGSKHKVMRGTARLGGVRQEWLHHDTDKYLGKTLEEAAHTLSKPAPKKPTTIAPEGTTYRATGEKSDRGGELHEVTLPNGQKHSVENIMAGPNKDREEWHRHGTGREFTYLGSKLDHAAHALSRGG